jgi:hypothetical protein
VIQRIQTVYLIIAGILVLILFFVPFAWIAGKDGTFYQLDINGILSGGIRRNDIIYNVLPLITICAVSLSLSLILLTIFLFKNRILQIRLSSATIFVLLGLGGLIYYYVRSSAKLTSGSYSFNIYILFPVIAGIMIYLAIRAIRKDELLVRSIDRIR